MGLQTAVYDSTLKAPKCLNAGSGCDSGPSLLLGRDTMSGGAEPNQPNTINNSCAEGPSGTLHFSYRPSMTDTITYDWQETQVQNSSGATLAQIMKVASNTQAWTQVTYDLTTYGQTIRVTPTIIKTGTGS